MLTGLNCGSRCGDATRPLIARVAAARFDDVLVCFVVSRDGERSVGAVMSNCTVVVLWGCSRVIVVTCRGLVVLLTRRPMTRWLRVGKGL